MATSDEELEIINEVKNVLDINKILEQLSKLIDIYKFDYNILYYDSALSNTRRVLEQRPNLKGFYSHNKVERDRAYETLIKEPLLKILTDVGQLCLQRTDNAKQLAQCSYLCLPEVRVDDMSRFHLFNEALKEIFLHRTKGLSALEDTLKHLQKPSEVFTDAQLENLSLVRSLAGFYYDRKAVSRLLELSKFTPTSDRSDRKVSWAILGFLELAGEYFDRLQPITLSFDKDIPDTAQDVLLGLRDTLSHLSHSELEEVHATFTTGTELFQNVLKDVKRLSASLETIHNRYEYMCKIPTDIWSQLKGEKTKAASGNDVRLAEKVRWKGFEELGNFLKAPERQRAQFHGASRADVQRSKYDQMLSLIDTIRETVGINTDLSLEINKNTHRELWNCKSKLLKEAISSLTDKLPHEKRQLAVLYAQLEETGKHIESTESNEEVETLVKTEKANQNNILEMFKAHAVDINPLKEELETMAWGGEVYKSAQVEMKAQTESNHRNSLFAMATTDKMKRHFGTYCKRLINTMKEFDKNMEDALKRLDDASQDVISELDRIHSAFLTKIEQLPQMSAISEAQRCIEEANQKQEAFHNLLESQSCVRFQQDKYFKVRATCTKNFTDIFREYLTDILAYRFIVATAYDIIEKLCNDQECPFLRCTIQIRHHYFHSSPFKEEPLVVNDGKNLDLSREETIEGELAKEISILCVVVRFFMK